MQLNNLSYGEDLRGCKPHFERKNNNTIRNDSLEALQISFK